MATRSRTDTTALSHRARLWAPWKTNPKRKGGCPVRESRLPSRNPKRTATVGCTMNRKRPGPERRAHKSKKNCRVNK